MKTIKLKNVVLFAFALTATAVVSSCSSDDDVTTTEDSKDRTITFTLGTSDKLIGDEVTRASAADAATPITEQNVDLGNGFTVSGTQIVDETVMNTVTRGIPTKSHLRLTDLKSAAGAYNQSNNITAIKCYWFKTDGSAANFDGTPVTNASEIQTTAITDDGSGTLKANVKVPSEAKKVVMYVGNKTVSGTTSYGTVKVDEVEAITGSTFTVDNSHRKRGKPNNTNNLFEAFYAGDIPADKTIQLTRLAARIRIVIRTCMGSSFQSSPQMYFSYWRFYLNNLSSNRGFAILRGDAMKNVPITKDDWNTSYDNNNQNTTGEEISNMTYLHSAMGSATDVNEDRDWYVEQRDNTGNKFASSAAHGANSWLSTSEDKRLWHDRFDVWYNFKPFRGTTPTGTYVGKTADSKSYAKSAVFVIQQNETYANDGCTTGRTSASDNNDIIFKVSSIGGSSYQIFKPGHSYTLYVYMKIVENASVTSSAVNSIVPFDWVGL